MSASGCILPFAIRSGGHNYAGFSTTRGLLIDVRSMNKVSPDLDQETVTIQCGANNQNMADALNNTNFAVPSGRCPTVGASGLVLGGGWGFSATHAGLTCDSLIATDIVLANGRKVTAKSGGETDDLFWALRGGGGGNFGVNTSFTFSLRDVKEPVTIFNIVWPGEQQVRMLGMLQKIQNDNARQISTRTKAFPDSPGAYPRRK
jgi:FAD/FMN-containing dehydrogenase